MDRLEIFLGATDDDGPIHVTLRALVFHMLQGVAPKLYSARQLEPLHLKVLEQCAKVSYGFDDPHADPDRLQAGIDAWYLRRVRGLPHAPPDRLLLRGMLEMLQEQGDTVYAWLLGELAAHAGVDARLKFDRAELKASRTHEAYYLTHLVMLDSVYFTRPLSHRDAADWSDAIAQLVPWLTRLPNPDLAGEVALCLHFLKRPEASAAKKLIEQVAPSQDTHQQATMLMALTAE